MSFTNAPVTRGMVLGMVGSSIAASLLDIKHYFYILVDPHIIRYHQTWRVFIFQLCYTNSSEVLFAAMALYNMRVVERLWGSRKYASFIAITTLLSTFIIPTLVFILRPLTFGLVSYVPAGPTAILFAILAQYRDMIPHVYKYRLAFSPSPPTNEEFRGLTLTDKTYRYLLAIQLALFQWPGSVLSAVVGWTIGYCWRNDLFPGVVTRWRLPGWMLGIRAQKRSEEFEGLRRRLEGDHSAGATASGAESQQPQGEAGRRRGMGQQLMDQIGGAL